MIEVIDFFFATLQNLWNLILNYWFFSLTVIFLIINKIIDVYHASKSD